MSGAPIAADLLIAGATLITMNGQRQVIEDGALAIAADRIVAAGKREALQREVRAKQVLDAATAEGLMILQAGPDVVRFAPSLVVEDADIDEGLARFERALSKLTAA